MNTPNPLVPQGSLQEQSKKKSQVRIIVFSILAVHVVLLGVLLINGCNKHEEPAPVLPPIITPPVDTNPPPPPPPPPTLTNPPAVISNPPPVLPDKPIEPPATAGEHTVAKGDTFAIIGKKYGVSIKAIQTANPGVDSRKLKIGQKLVIPAKPPGTTPSGSSAKPETELASGETLYTVVKNDNLTKIAKAHGTSPKAIRTANNLKTDQLKVGQKLKMPGKAAPAAPTAPATPALTAPPATPIPPMAPPSGPAPSSP